MCTHVKICIYMWQLPCVNMDGELSCFNFCKEQMYLKMPDLKGKASSLVGHLGELGNAKQNFHF